MGLDVLGDRLNSGFCLKCGALLFQPWNDYQCCSGCTNDILKALTAFEYKRKKRRYMDKVLLVHKKYVAKQIMPIGVPVN